MRSHHFLVAAVFDDDGVLGDFVILGDFGLDLRMSRRSGDFDFDLARLGYSGALVVGAAFFVTRPLIFSLIGVVTFSWTRAWPCSSLAISCCLSLASME
jgi:hypothetical protein